MCSMTKDLSRLNRSLSLLADGAPVSGFRRAWLTGRDALGLMPMPFVLRVWNLSEDGYYTLRSAKQLSVLHGDSVLAAGKVSDVYRRIVLEGTVTEVIFSAGLDLWEAKVSLSVEAGTSVSETVRRILAASGTEIPLLSFPGVDPGSGGACRDGVYRFSGDRGHTEYSETVRRDLRGQTGNRQHLCGNRYPGRLCRGPGHAPGSAGLRLERDVLCRHRRVSECGNQIQRIMHHDLIRTVGGRAGVTAYFPLFSAQTFSNSDLLISCEPRKYTDLPHRLHFFSL